MCDTPTHASNHLCLVWKESIQDCRSYRAGTGCGTDGRTDWMKPIYPATTLLCVWGVCVCVCVCVWGGGGGGGGGIIIGHESRVNWTQCSDHLKSHDPLVMSLKCFYLGYPASLIQYHTWWYPVRLLLMLYGVLYLTDISNFLFFYAADTTRKLPSELLQNNSVQRVNGGVCVLVYFPREASRRARHTFDIYCNGIISLKGGYMTHALWTSNGKKGSVKWRCEHAQSRGFLGNFVNLHNATS